LFVKAMTQKGLQT